MKKIVILVEKTATGFSAYARDYSVYSTGSSMAELTQHMVEALTLYFETIEADREVKETDLAFEVDLQSVFEVFPVNVKALAQRIGMNYTLLSQYVTGQKVASAKQKKRILEGIHAIGREMAELSLV
ncbi:hypothetical protein QWY31_02100 [Cytophagales bacterium LB-30]|uniref:Type II toxin-antitoxin system HicB family antitoxin n=1 Tax=Shiella aurantiaca TaxID=3058365 RepID=A0ABT8F1E2_9BACT|nr:hypothetical protein [Shiella aurantiaca]MDN4164272.1 hypothetical protein [Shiella aurantiaca]